jgi:hypothetical protein
MGIVVVTAVGANGVDSVGDFILTTTCTHDNLYSLQRTKRKELS